jgi:solute carrier family 25 carnitine/acylcarnitine transporter 20/29
VVSCPTELVKIRLQNQVDKQDQRAYKGSWDGIQRVFRAEGLRGLYRGMGSTVLRETPSYGAYFAGYEYFCQLLAPDGGAEYLSGTQLLLAGGFAGIVGWISTYPVTAYLLSLLVRVTK